MAWDGASRSRIQSLEPTEEFVDTYARIVQNYSAQGKNRTDPETLKMLGIPRQALDALINVRVISYAAKRLGVDVSPEEVRRAIEVLVKYRFSK